MGLLCLMITLLWSCQNDDQNEPTPLSQEDYATYESDLLIHMRHFGEQIRNNSSLGFDDESLKSISSSYFEADDHAEFADAIDNPSTAQLSAALQGKVDELQAVTDEFDEHTDYLSHLNDQFSLEFDSDELDLTDKNSLLVHIIHLRVTTQFLHEHSDVFLSSTSGRTASNVDWWLVSGKCALRALNPDVSKGVQDDISALNQSSTSAQILSATNDAKQNCNSDLFLTALDFSVGLATDPYCASPPCDETTVYNMYSYGFLKTSGVVKEGNAPVQSLSDFHLPQGELDTVVTNFSAGEGPYIGKNEDDKHFALTDCSGYVSYILKKTNSPAYKEVFKTVQDGSNQGISHLSYCPSASQFANFDIGSSQNWAYVGSKGDPDFSKIQAGDIIAWDEKPDADGDTGHVMIAAGPSRGSDQSCFYLVDIFDSTIDSHLNNSRFGIQNDSNTPTGVGFGTIGLRKDGNDHYSNFFPTIDGCETGTDPWKFHPTITILRLSSN